MWHSIPNRRDVGLGVARGAVAITGGAVNAVSEFTNVCTESFDMRANAQKGQREERSVDNDLRSALGRIRGQQGRGARRARVVIGTDLSCHWILAPVQGARSMREIQSVAQARFAALFDERPGEWQVTADWRIDRPFLCAAVPKWILRDIDAATPQAPALRSAGTVFGRALELFHRSLPDDGWCCIRSTHSLALLLVRKGCPITLRTLPLAQGLSLGGTLDAGVEALQREAACLALEPVLQATWLDLAEPPPAGGSRVRTPHAGVHLKVRHLRHRHRATQAGAPARSEAAIAAWLGDPVEAVLS